MNVSDLTSEILDALGFDPTRDQQQAVRVFAEFMFTKKAEVVMLLCGSAGTGKTSIASAMVRTLARLGQHIVLLAPTGRAAKVFSLNAAMPANTIHRKIYRQRSFDGLDTAFRLAENKQRNTLFVVDEASMISNQSSGADLFGSGCLLDDLIQYVYSGTNCRLMLIGDKAQLPPVGLIESPALDRAMLERYGLEVSFANLDEVLRQSQSSGILFNATAIRRIATANSIAWPTIQFNNFPDVHIISGNELIDSLCNSYAKVGLDGTMVVTRSNKRANIYNQGIRKTILGREAELTVGDRLMVVKNNYFWTDMANRERQKERLSNEGDSSDIDSLLSLPSFLANGDIAIVQRAAHYQEAYGFRFADVTLEFPDYDGYEIDVRILLNSLSSESPSLTREEQTQLYEGVAADYAHIKARRRRLMAVREDAFYNAVQVKFAYAVTCHKSQGGQWEHVYIDQGYMAQDMLDQDYIHWLYTAFTRATKELFLVNWPKGQIASNQ